MVAAWNAGEYESPSAMAHDFEVDPSYARRVIREARSRGKIIPGR
jgi:hypothetical protein